MLFRRRASLAPPARESLARLLRAPTFELVPLKNALDQAKFLPAGVTVSVTASPAKGIEATVVVKFVVTESGDVTGVTIVRGHPMFDAAVLAAVRSWRYQPAMFEGRPIRVYRVARIPFKLKT